MTTNEKILVAITLAVERAAVDGMAVDFIIDSCYQSILKDLEAEKADPENEFGKKTIQINHLIRRLNQGEEEIYKLKEEQSRLEGVIERLNEMVKPK